MLELLRAFQALSRVLDLIIGCVYAAGINGVALPISRLMGREGSKLSQKVWTRTFSDHVARRRIDSLVFHTRLRPRPAVMMRIIRLIAAFRPRLRS
ncbi:hypothetical protein BAUCODRAFT_170112 [Baudoinia panamericana UAMH 10762]|uniref:Uncharacterized protein n=1 Tax=Baudoinia panamericana (strain UAMH 10762) TaxID=717646 RepID=M2NLU3_BAUPA|nr:uncharacterized protein BAUCODRAFT_170112 [Baudoinia panamericana UAMH 10762]EMD00465.1 hypothetical protein BAUCODRAFT_170112 [Baudoinia panamericana UAMH 10762]